MDGLHTHGTHETGSSCSGNPPTRSKHWMGCSWPPAEIYAKSFHSMRPRSTAFISMISTSVIGRFWQDFDLAFVISPCCIDQWVLMTTNGDFTDNDSWRSTAAVCDRTCSGREAHNGTRCRFKILTGKSAAAHRFPTQ